MLEGVAAPLGEECPPEEAATLRLAAQKHVDDYGRLRGRWAPHCSASHTHAALSLHSACSLCGAPSDATLPCGMREAMQALAEWEYHACGADRGRCCAGCRG